MSNRFKKKQTSLFGAGAVSDPDTIADFLFDEGLQVTKNKHLQEGLLNPGKFLEDKTKLIKGKTADSKNYFKIFYQDILDITKDKKEAARVAQSLSTHIYNVYMAEIDKVYPSATAGKISVMTPLVKQ